MYDMLHALYNNSINEETNNVVKEIKKNIEESNVLSSDEIWKIYNYMVGDDNSYNREW